MPGADPERVSEMGHLMRSQMKQYSYPQLRDRLCAAAMRIAFVPVLLVASLAVTGLWSSTADATSRIKDIADFEGIRDNFLVGYGLVVGLNGTGDSLNNAPFTKQSLEAMLERLGVNTRDASVNTDNVAAVMITAILPPFARQGTRVDVTISTIGDSENLLGGTLLATPLLGADGEVYAVAQGSLVVGGFVAQGDAETVTKGVPTTGRISNGAIIEREIDFDFSRLSQINITLRNPDLTTAVRMSQAINAFMGSDVSHVPDPGTVQFLLPKSERGNLIPLLTNIEQLRVSPDQVARIVVDESTGTIVMGEEVRVSTVAIAQGALTIRITETPQVSQPQAFSEGGETTTVARTSVQVDDSADKKLSVLETGVSLQELVDGLNSLGIGPRDMISILQTIKAAGALQAEIVVM